MIGADLHQTTCLFLSLGVLLTAARVFGEIARRLRQPAVIGEILAGIVLGPTVLGAVAPGVSGALFPPQGPNADMLRGLAQIAVALFLLVAGMEVDLSVLIRLRRTAMIIGACGVVIPFAIGFGAARVAPGALGMEADADRLVFAMFLGVALAISALPVIARTLMDLGLFRTELGMIVIAAAVFHDLVGWIVFAIILGMMGSGGAAPLGAAGVTAVTLGFAAFMLTAGRWAINRALPWIQAHTSWPGGVLGFALSLGLFGAAFTEWIGVHAMFGAFLVGVALGDSPHLLQRARSTIEQFIAFIFAPVFFASIGLHMDFRAHFDLPLVLFVLVIACTGQTLGSALGARLTGFPRRQSWAIGFALNARGAMGIVLAMLALEAGVIGDRLFVALVVMAITTSLIAGPMMQWVLQRTKRLRFTQFIAPRGYLPDLKARDRKEAIRELSEALAAAVPTGRGATSDQVFEAAWARERILSTALPNGIAIPHARVAGLEKPLIAVGRALSGVEFDASDGQPTRLVLLIVTPESDDHSQLELAADIASTFESEEIVRQAMRAESLTQLLASVNARSASPGIVAERV